MRALTFSARLIDLSYNYDGLTIYPRFANYRLMIENMDLQKFSNALNSCNKLPFIASHEKSSENNSLNLSHLFQPTNDTNRNEFLREIYREDNDHDFYHKDDFNKKDFHYHLKFKYMISYNDLNQVLGILQDEKVLSSDERQRCLLIFESRYRHLLDFKVLLTKSDSVADSQFIIKHIKKLNDNDILAHLHQGLLEAEFDYLRHINENEAVNYCGENNKGGISATSKKWAMIEKAFALQMEKNIIDNVSKFNIDVAEERSLQLKQTHSFFSIKRKFDGKNILDSKNYQNFHNANEDNLVKSHNKHFNQC